MSYDLDIFSIIAEMEIILNLASCLQIEPEKFCALLFLAEFLKWFSDCSRPLHSPTDPHCQICMVNKFLYYIKFKA